MVDFLFSELIRDAVKLPLQDLSLAARGGVVRICDAPRGGKSSDPVHFVRVASARRSAISSFCNAAVRSNTSPSMSEAKL